MPVTCCLQALTKRLEDTNGRFVTHLFHLAFQGKQPSLAGWSDGCLPSRQKHVKGTHSMSTSPQ